jgi:hypothetical protein
MDAEARVCEVCDEPANEERGHVFLLTRKVLGKPVVRSAHGGCVAELDASPFRKSSD